MVDNPIKNYSREFVRGCLLKNGFSIRKWSEETGWAQELVRAVLLRYCGHDRTPKGPKTKAILADLGRICSEEG